MAKEEVLVSQRAGESCPVCHIGNIPVNSAEKKTLTIYGRGGQRTVEIISYRCNNRNSGNPCRAGIYPGYVTTKGHLVFEADALQQEVLITSEQTGFDIEYLIELAYRVQIQGITFESEANSLTDFILVTSLLMFFRRES